MNMQEKFEKFIKENDLFSKNEKIVLGVSGGVDSVVLLDLLNKQNLDITVAHLNHGLRRVADKDELFVEALAKRYDNHFYSKKVKLSKKNVEESGRKERYSFFDSILKEKKLDSIVTAHNANDSAETILLNLVRGAGIKGLSGISLVKRNLKRPLLKFSKEDILIYAKQNNLKWREDLSNKSLFFDRNRIRHKVLPEFTKINPKALNNILRAGENLAEAEEFINEYTTKIYNTLKKEENGKLVLDLKGLQVESDLIKKRVILLAITAYLEKDVASIHLTEILELLKKKGTKELSLPLGLKVTKIYDNLEIGFIEEKSSVFVPVEVKNKLKTSNWQIAVKKVERKGRADKETAYLDGSKIKRVLLRQKKDGDYLYLNDKGQKKKLSDLFIDQKIPKKKRENYPIIVNEKDEVLFVPGIRINSKYRATESSKAIIKLQAKNEK